MDPAVQKVRRRPDPRIWSGGWVPGDIVLAGGSGLVAGGNAVTSDDLLIKVPLALIAIPVLVLTMVMVAGLEPGRRPTRVVRSWLARAGGSGLIELGIVAVVGATLVRQSPASAAVLLTIAMPPLVIEARNRWGGPGRIHAGATRVNGEDPPSRQSG